MTRFRMAQIILSYFNAVENDHIAYGCGEREAKIEACLDGGITQSEYREIINLLNNPPKKRKSNK